VSLSACFLFERDNARLQVAPEAPVEIRMGCALAESRCTRCHTIDRVLNAHVDSPTHWQAYVHRMRLQPQSGILPDEEPPILRCLVYRSFGSAGVASLPPESVR
jgi:hypothetical protein